MFAALMEEEAEIAVGNDEEHLMMLSCLMALYARSNAKPHRGGSAPGRRKSKPRQRLEGTAFSTPTIRQQPIARRGGILVPFSNEPEALPRHCLRRSAFRQLLHMQEGLHWYG
jgi:hypothetical protein